MADCDCSGLCCCDLTPHPDDRLTWTGSRAEGKRYQLVSGSCHVEFLEATVHTSAETESTIVKFFTTPEPTDTAEDVNLWNLVLGKTEGSAAWTPDQFQGLYFPNGIFAEVMSVDTTAEAVINIVYYRRDTYIPAIVERPNERRRRLWSCYNDTPYGDNFPDGAEGDDYTDTTSSSTPGSGTGEPLTD
jgi:hypothetical protein